MAAHQNPADAALRARALVAGPEYRAVYNSGGVCEALALKWLKVKFKENSNAPEWAHLSRQKAGPRVNIVDRDKTFDRAFARYAAGAADVRFGMEDYYGLRGQFDPNLHTTTVGATSYVARTVAKSKHGYFLHSIRCPAIDPNGYHAIAYYTSSGKAFNLSSHVYMFDPDYGEYKVPNSDFIAWMPRFVNHFYGTGEGDSRWLKTMGLGNKRATP
jgi:hypothetical protein